MTGRADNDGIWIEGSATVIAGAMAAGPGATAVGAAHSPHAPADLGELRAALAALVAQLQSGPAGVDDPDRWPRSRYRPSGRRGRASRTSAFSAGCCRP